MKRKTFLKAAAAAVILAFFLSGCTLHTPLEAEYAFSLYYLNDEQDRLETVAYTPAAAETIPMIDELIARQGSGSEDGKLYSLLPKEVKITGSVLDGTTLILDFSPKYKEMPIGREALVRGGIVREFLQVDGVDQIMFTVDGEALADSAGNEIGAMTNESFVENSAETINAYQSASMTLYFTDQAGTVLIPETRKVYYISSEPLERAVVDELLRGPRVTGSSPVFGSEYTVLSVVTQDDTCYVNLNSSSGGITTTTTNAKEDVQIYALVNSLVDTCGVKQVQITLDGESNRMFRDKMSLSSPFTKNEELLQ